MNRRRSLCLVAALVSLTAACGRVVVDPDDRDGTKGASSTTGGSGATTGGTGGESPGGGGMCNTPPPPSPTVPKQPGCFKDMGDGWVQVPCLCELWMANTTFAPVTAGIQLLVTPPEQVPTLTGSLDVGVAFDDPDAIGYATWTKQAGNGAAFTVANAGGTTTVRMGQGSVTLAPIPVAACTTRKATAQVIGSDSAKLSLHAVLDYGTPFATADGTCFPPPLP